MGVYTESMSDNDINSKKAEEDARKKRLEEALRANLRRRKEQARRKKSGDAGTDSGSSVI